MRKRINLLFLGLLFTSIWSYSQTLETKFQAIIDSIYTANHTSVGIMVHVEYPEQGISWSGASGYSNKTTKNKLEPNQPALIASCTKSYVSATILCLVEEKRLDIHQPIEGLLSEKTKNLFIQGGYALDSIAIKHLLSHTSGIDDYANKKAYHDFVNENQKHRWTRDEQLERAIKLGKPLGIPGATFSYADANYLLLTEIIENITQKPFYTAIRELLRYDTLGLNNTWFPTLEEKPKKTESLVHQYWGEYNWDSYNHDISWDLYGGGGIACNTEDLARFYYSLFNYKIIKDPSVLDLIFTKIHTNDSVQQKYYLGVAQEEYKGLKAYGHGGFWGTKVLYFPELDCSISIYVLDKDRANLRKLVIDKIVGIIIG